MILSRIQLKYFYNIVALPDDFWSCIANEIQLVDDITFPVKPDRSIWLLIKKKMYLKSTDL